MEQNKSARFAIIAEEIFDGLAMRRAAAVVVESGRILGFAAPGELPHEMERITLAPGVLLSPGFVDWQVNGGDGQLVNARPEESAIGAIAATHRAFGTTSLLPTLITDAQTAIERLREVDLQRMPGVVGFHIEGPFINMDKRGAHPAAHVRALSPADVELLSCFVERGVCVVTLAPERVPPGAIRQIVDTGVVVSLGHSNASAPCARAAADEGASGVTHLFNAMSQITAREPGLVGAAFADSRLSAGVIADGEHVDPLNLALAHKIMGPDRLMLVSDAMPSVGGRSLTFDLLGREVVLSDGRLAFEDGTLAGAHLSMAEAVQRMARLAHAPLPDVLRMATRTPARFLGLEHEIGMLRPGAYADIIALDQKLHVTNVWFHGEPVAARNLNEMR